MATHLVFYTYIVFQNSGNLGQNEQCYSPNMPPDFTSCSFVIVAWAIGGGVRKEVLWMP